MYFACVLAYRIVLFAAHKSTKEQQKQHQPQQHWICALFGANHTECACEVEKFGIFFITIEKVQIKFIRQIVIGGLLFGEFTFRIKKEKLYRFHKHLTIRSTIS